jgi:hypothetical protein
VWYLVQVATERVSTAHEVDLKLFVLFSRFAGAVPDLIECKRLHRLKQQSRMLVCLTIWMCG